MGKKQSHTKSQSSNDSFEMNKYYCCRSELHKNLINSRVFHLNFEIKLGNIVFFFISIPLENELETSCIHHNPTGFKAIQLHFYRDIRLESKATLIASLFVSIKFSSDLTIHFLLDFVRYQHFTNLLHIYEMFIKTLWINC